MRGCGATRKVGGVYVETRPSPNGRSVEFFLTDPVQPLPKLGITKRGVNFFTLHGVRHILDWVGESHYPFVTDFIEETRAHGLSRLVTPTIAREGLTQESCIFLAHAQALVTNPEQLAPYLYDGEAKRRCAHFVRSQKLDHIDNSSVACTRFLYALPPVADHVEQGDTVFFRRKFTDATHYMVSPFLPGAPEPRLMPGIFAVLPITHISVVAGGSDDDAALESLRKGVAGIPVSKTPA